MKKFLALAVALSMIICIGIKFNVVSMNSSEDLANQALIKEWQQTISKINEYEAHLTNSTQNDQGIVELILHALREKKQELEKNPHVQTFMSLMNQTTIREAIPVLNCKAYLRPKFTAFMYAHVDCSRFLLEPDHLIINGFVWSPDSTKLAMKTEDADNDDKTIEIWDTNTGTLMYTLDHPTALYEVTWSPDGTKLATGSTAGAQIWDASTGILIKTFPHKRDPFWIAWSPDSTKLAIGSNSETQIWDAVTEALVFTLKTPAHKIAWSPDGTKLAIKDWHDAQIWDTKTGALIRTFSHYDISSISWNPDSIKLATVSRDGAQVWDVNTGALIYVIKHRFIEVAWSPDGTKLATASKDGGARIYDAHTGALLSAIQQHTEFSSMTWSPDGTKLATISSNGTQIWDGHTGELIRMFHHMQEDEYEMAVAIAWSLDSTKLAIQLQSTDDSVEIVNLSELNQIQRFLDSPNIDQCDLLRAIDMAMQQNGRIQATPEQQATFKTLPLSMQRAFEQYITEPLVPISHAERQRAFEQRQATSTTITQPSEEQAKEHSEKKSRMQEPAEPLQEQNNDDDDDTSLSSRGKEKDTGPRKMPRKK